MAAGAAAPPDVSADTRRRVVLRIREDTRVNEAGAQRMLDGALQFLALAGAMRRGEIEDFPTVPSPLVDYAWHAFILHTLEYTEYCEAHCGGFVHHNPTPELSADEAQAAQDGYARTRAAIGERFGALDELLWPE
jgi:hypothetical protein